MVSSLLVVSRVLLWSLAHGSGRADRNDWGGQRWPECTASLQAGFCPQDVLALIQRNLTLIPRSQLAIGQNDSAPNFSASAAREQIQWKRRASLSQQLRTLSSATAGTEALQTLWRFTDKLQSAVGLTKSKRAGKTHEQQQGKMNEHQQRKTYMQQPSTGTAHYDSGISIPIMCVMHLTFQGVVMYCLLSLARNFDELLGHHPDEPSQWTETLIAAARSISYPAVLSCLFIAVNMHVLASTEGHGRPQWWVKHCMVAATCGMTLQYLLVLALPFVVDLSTDPNKLSFAERCGGVADVHPRVNRFDGFYVSVLFRVLFKVAQFCIMIMIYGGTAGSAIGMFQYDGAGANQEAPSPSFVATTIIVASFLTVRLGVWRAWARSRQGNTQALAASTGPQRAALAAVFAMQKGPMLALLFLAARLRAMQLDPWNGKPQEWARHSFYWNAAALVLEACIAALIGAIGEEQIGYYGASIFKCQWRTLHLLQHGCMAASMAGVSVVYESLWTLKAAEGPTPEFPPTMQCIITLTVMYFSVQGGLYFSFFLQQVFRWQWKLMQDTLLAANTSVSFTPMLGILFLCARLRAVQVTHFTGSPQSWAQDAMYLCVFASMVQALCCIALPALTGNESGVDEDGIPTHELGNMMSAYVVTVVKYFVLAVLIGGVSVIIYSACIISPENANYSGKDGGFHTVEHFGWAFLGLLLGMLLSSAKVVGHAVKMIVTRAPLPIPLKVDKVVLSIWHGYVELKGVIVPNLWKKKHGFASEYLMQVKSVVIWFDIGLMFRSLFKTIDIGMFVVKGVELNYEKTRCGNASNVSVLMDKLKPPEKKKQESKLAVVGKKIGDTVGTCVPQVNRPSWCHKPGWLPSPTSCFKGATGCWSKSSCGRSPPTKETGTENGDAGKADSGQPGEETSSSNVQLHRLEIKAVEAYLWHNGSKKMTVQLGNLAFDDFAQEKVQASDVAAIVLSTLLKSIVSNGALLRSALVDIATIPCPSFRPKKEEDDAPKQAQIYMGSKG